MQQSWKRRISVALVIALLLGAAVVALPQKTQAAWCDMNASFAGQNGWQGANPNYEVWFPLDAGAHAPFYIYYDGNYVGPDVLAPHGLHSGTTRFGVSTIWAILHPGWANASKWRIDYTC